MDRCHLRSLLDAVLLKIVIMLFLMCADSLYAMVSSVRMGFPNLLLLALVSPICRTSSHQLTFKGSCCWGNLSFSIANLLHETTALDWISDISEFDRSSFYWRGFMKVLRTEARSCHSKALKLMVCEWVWIIVGCMPKLWGPLCGGSEPSSDVPALQGGGVATSTRFLKER